MSALIGVILIALLASAHSANKIKSRIVNGAGASVGQFPFYAYLDIFNRDGSNEFCGATLISDQWLVTAAHCTFYAKSLTVHLGMSRLSTDAFRRTEGYKTFIVEEGDFFEYPNYILRAHWNDIALVKLPNKVEFSNYIQPVRMPNNCKVPKNAEMYAMGNGRVMTNGKASEQLMFASLEKVPLHKCWRKYPILFLRQSIVCAMDKSNYQSICDGDSGSPLVRKSDGTFIGLAALVSGEGCNPEYPQVFTNIISYMKWIKKETGLNLPDC